MLDYGFDAVRRSLRNAKLAASANPLGRHAFRAMLRTAQAVAPLKRRMFGGACGWLTCDPHFPYGKDMPPVES
jgi:hypothetical protein